MYYTSWPKIPARTLTHSRARAHTHTLASPRTHPHTNPPHLTHTVPIQQRKSFNSNRFRAFSLPRLNTERHIRLHTSGGHIIWQNHWKDWEPQAEKSYRMCFTWAWWRWPHFLAPRSYEGRSIVTRRRRVMREYVAPRYGFPSLTSFS